LNGLIKSHLASLEFSQYPEKTKQPTYEVSYKGLTILVKISAKKKCLNLTIPNGEIKIL
jgi:hypothetical protein